MQLDELFGHLLTHELRLEQQATVPDLGTPMANLATKTTNSTPQGRPHSILLQSGLQWFSWSWSKQLFS
jgi:hypothetical protein